MGLIFCFLDKDNTVDHPRPSEKDKKLVILKSPNAVNPLVWDYAVSTASSLYRINIEKKGIGC